MLYNSDKPKEAEFIELIKTEINIVFNQMHTRMNHKYTISSISAIIAGSIVKFHDSSLPRIEQYSDNLSSNLVFQTFLENLNQVSYKDLTFSGSTTAIFWIFALLILREDLLLIIHDKYIAIPIAMRYTKLLQNNC